MESNKKIESLLVDILEQLDEQRKIQLDIYGLLEKICVDRGGKFAIEWSHEGEKETMVIKIRELLG